MSNELAERFPPLPEPESKVGVVVFGDPERTHRFTADQMREYAARAIREAESEAAEVCGEAYQVVGVLLSDTGQFDTPHGEKVLDNLSAAKRIHKDVLPWSQVGELTTYPKPTPDQEPTQ